MKSYILQINLKEKREKERRIWREEQTWFGFWLLNCGVHMLIGRHFSFYVFFFFYWLWYVWGSLLVSYSTLMYTLCICTGYFVSYPVSASTTAYTIAKNFTYFHQRKAYPTLNRVTETSTTTTTDGSFSFKRSARPLLLHHTTEGGNTQITQNVTVSQ